MGDYSLNYSPSDTGADGIGASYGKSISKASFSMYIVRTDVELKEYNSQEVMLFLNGRLDDGTKEYLNKYLFNDYVLIPGSTADNYDDYLHDFIESGYAEKWYMDGGYCE